jgi:hypothetical protein
MWWETFMTSPSILSESGARFYIRLKMKFPPVHMITVTGRIRQNFYRLRSLILSRASNAFLFHFCVQ